MADLAEDEEVLGEFAADPLVGPVVAVEPIRTVTDLASSPSGIDPLIAPHLPLRGEQVGLIVKRGTRKPREDCLDRIVSQSNRDQVRDWDKLRVIGMEATNRFHEILDHPYEAIGLDAGLNATIDLHLTPSVIAYY
jgi:hypothetical protein